MIQVYRTNELANLLGVDRHLIGSLRRYGILQGTKLGQGYVYSEDEVKEFLKEYRGADLSNGVCMQIELAKHKKDDEPLTKVTHHLRTISFLLYSTTKKGECKKMKKLEKGWYQIFNTGYKINPKWMIESACELFTVDALAIYAFIKITEMIF